VIHFGIVLALLLLNGLRTWLVVLQSAFLGLICLFLLKFVDLLVGWVLVKLIALHSKLDAIFVR
jgi:hypothetical protein